MVRDERVDLRGIGSNEKHSTGTSKRLLFSNYRYLPRAVQCKKCGSDYMRFASIDGFCQRCQQRVEYVTRERPDIMAKIAKREAI